MSSNNIPAEFNSIVDHRYVTIFDYIFDIVILILNIGIIVGIIVTVPAIVIDIKQKKFHWTKWILIALVGMIILFFILTYIAELLGIIPINYNLQGIPPSGGVL